MQKKLLVGVAVAACLGLLIAVSTSRKSEATPQVRAAFTTRSTFNAPSDAPDPNEVFRLVNEARVEEGLSALKPNLQLTEVAEARAYDMSKNHYYAHKDLSGNFFDAMFAKKGFSTDYSCENLDLEFTTDPQRYVNDWLYSPFGHRNCLLNKTVTDAGYAVSLLPDTTYGNTTTNAFIVVAIHGTTPKAN